MLEADAWTVVRAGRSASGSVDVEIDAEHPETLDETLGKTLSEQAFTGVVNCIGSLWLKPAHMTSLEVWEHTMKLHLTSSFLLLKNYAKNLPKEGGSLVLVSSAAGRIGLANHEAIAAAKAGIIGMVMAAAATYGSRGLRVNCVAPGLTDTPLTAGLTANEASLKVSEKMHALGRIGKPEDVASAICWLLDPRNRWVTGQTLGVDGGLGTVRARG